MEEGKLYIVTVDFQEYGDRSFSTAIFTANSEREIRNTLKMINPAKRSINLDVPSVWMCKEDDFAKIYEKADRSGLPYPMQTFATFIEMQKKGLLEPLYWD